MGAGLSNQWLHVLIDSAGLLVGGPIAGLTDAPVAVPAVLAMLVPYAWYWWVEYMPKRITLFGKEIPVLGQWPINPGEWWKGKGSDHPIDSAFHFIGRAIAVGGTCAIWQYA